MAYFIIGVALAFAYVTYCSYQFHTIDWEDRFVSSKYGSYGDRNFWINHLKGEWIFPRFMGLMAFIIWPISIWAFIGLALGHFLAQKGKTKT